jgi:Iron-dependent Transcriptional regulator
MVGGLARAPEVAEEAAIPRKSLELILVRLRDHGLIESRRGVHGGYRLLRDPDKNFGRGHHPFRGWAVGTHTMCEPDAIPPMH